MLAPPEESTRTLIDDYIAEQSRLQTPVARFAAAHAAGKLTAPAPRSHSTLIPLSSPRPGEQFAFEVDLDSCTGCKSCVAGCHSLNGLDDDETWRDVGLLVSTDRRHAFTQTVTTACHHCEDPACLNGCPVLAYEKDPITGIVVHLDDQCIGCSYCVLKCPYDVPKFSERLGIVRKCDMCHNRLAAGEAPACVQACPTEAIRIVTVIVTPPQNRKPETGDRKDLHSDISGLRSPVSGFTFLPGAPDPSYTRPTTRYISKRPLPTTITAADAHTLRPQPPHWPLVIMLTLLPLAVGLSVLAAFLPPAPNPIFTYYVKISRAGLEADPARGWAIAAVLCGAAGLGASVFHLGQPMRAWRIFLGWRKSWLSREAMVFGAWFPLAASAVFLPQLAPLGAGIGLLGLACSVMIYVDTRRGFWRLAQTGPRFFGTAALGFLAVTAPFAAAFALLAKLTWESRTYFDGSVSARLQRGSLARAVLWRDGLGLMAVVLLATLPGWPAFVLLAGGELMERYLFFRAVDAPKMPGQPSGAPARKGAPA